MRVEGRAELGPVVGKHPGDGDTEATELAADAVEEPCRDLGVRRSEKHVADRPTGRGVDRGELPDLPDPFEVPDVEAVQGDQVTRTGREVTEPERAVSSVVGEQTGGRGSQLGERPDALTTPAELVTTQDLLHPTRRDLEPSRPSRRRNDELPTSGAPPPPRGVHRPPTPGSDSASPAVDGLWASTPRDRQSRPGVATDRTSCGSPRTCDTPPTRSFPGMFHDTHTPVIDDLIRGHGDGLLWLCGRNQRVHRRGHQMVDLQPQLVNWKT